MTFDVTIVVYNVIYKCYTFPCAGCLGIADLGAVLERVWEARVKWYNIGLKLGTSPSTLDAIKIKCREDPDECVTAMIKEWLNNGNPPPSWTPLAEALRSPMVGYAHLAEQLPNI